MQGGAQWTGASVNPYNNVMYVTANNIAWKVGVQTYKKKSRFKFIAVSVPHGGFVPG